MTARTRLIALAATLVLSTGVLAACSDSDDDSASNASSSQTEPDVSGLPKVVAVVDDAQITKDEFVTAYEAQFRLAASQAQQSGQPIDQDQLRQQTAESLVSTQLLVNEADRRDYTVTQKDRDDTLADLAEENGVASGDELLASLAEQGVDAEEANRQLDQQVKLDRLVAEEGGDADPTEEQLRALYDEVVAQQEQAGSAAGEVPAFDDARSQLEDQVRSENENAAAQKLVETLRKDAEVTINL